MPLPLIGALGGAGNAIGLGLSAMAIPSMIEQGIDLADMVLPEGYELTSRNRNSQRLAKMSRDFEIARGAHDSARYGEEKLLGSQLSRITALKNAASQRYDFGSQQGDQLNEASFMDQLRTLYGPRLGPISAQEVPTFMEWAARQGVAPRPMF